VPALLYTHLTLDERCVIAHLSREDLDPCEIARQIGRSPGTICRELARNGNPKSVYQARSAQHRHDQRRCEANAQREKTRHKPLQQAIKRGLNQRWSPKIISEQLKRNHPRPRKCSQDRAMRVSAPTIYAYLKRDTISGGTSGGGGNLEKQLPRRGKGRKPYGSRGKRRDAMPGRKCITERPPGAENRSRLGHWEGDTVEGSHKASHVVTMVDRKSRFTLIGKAKDKSAATINTVITSLLERLPQCLPRTTTLDNGTEFSGFKQLEQNLNMAIYFAHPYSPWERGTNEQTNGLLRMFLPKGTDFRYVSDVQLARIETMLNNRPRKCLNYRTPAEVFKPPPSVALRI
jgi:IS30 family transposase